MATPAQIATVRSLYKSWDPANRSEDGWCRHFSEDSTWTNIPIKQSTYHGMAGQRDNYRMWIPLADKGHVEITELYSGHRDGKPGQAFVVVESLGCDPSNGLKLPVCDVHWLNEENLICRTNRYWDNSQFAAK